MEVTILGSGSPPPQTSRGGQSLLVTIDDELILVDCGPLTVERLLEKGTTLADVNTLFFTHQHMDHNASFFHFAITSWMYGRESLAVYGPAGTEALLDALQAVYAEDFEYRRTFGRPMEGVRDIAYERTTEGFHAAGDRWEATACAVEHSIETYAYRFQDDDGGTVVYSADTGNPEPLVEFAADADVLVQNCGAAPWTDDPSAGTSADRLSREQYLASNPPPEETPIVEQHCHPVQAAEVGEAADVDVLVLTHFMPMLDADATREVAADVFSGTLYLAEDGLTLTT